MAKSAFQQKKRISHFQIPTENENMSGGCLDYVSSIIKTMDTSFKSVQSDYSKMQTMSKSMNNEEESNNSSQRQTSGSKRGNSQSSKSFGKKLSISRKFPLMEKSQKILKQLKHNRSISKPRAHLAAFPNSPVERTVSIKDSSRTVRIPTKRENTQQTAQKEKLKHVSKMKNSSDVGSCSTLPKISTCTVNNTNIKNTSNSKVSKKIEETHRTIHSTDLNESNVDKHLGSANLNSKKNSEIDVNAFKSSDDESGDSEYEMFIKKNKKGLCSKKTTSKKQSTANRKASVKNSKKVQRKSESNSDQSDSDYNSFASSSTNSQIKNNYKKCKVAQLQTDSDSESNDEELRSDLHTGISSQDPVIESVMSDMELITNDNDESSQNSVYESNVNTDDSTSDEDVESSNLTAPDSLITVGNALSVNCKTDTSISDKDVETSNLTASDSRVTIGNVVSVNCKTDTSISDKDVESSNLTASGNHITTDNVVSVNYTPVVSLSHNDSLGEKMTESNNSSAIVIDLCDSDDEDSKIGVCTKLPDISEQTGFSNEDSANQTEIIKGTQNVSNFDSEDSDIEIIEILQTKSKDHCQVNVSYSNSELPIKTERNVNASSIKSEYIKHEPVFSTDMQANMSVSVDESVLIRTGVKRENDFDDVVILPTEELPNVSNISACKKVKTECNIIESLKSVKYSAHKILMSDFVKHDSDIPLATDWKNSNIKNEQATNSSSIVSQIKNVISVDKLLSSDSETTLNQINNRNLIEIYKKEFQAYQEIVQTEATISASLKALENRQAEKVKLIQSLVKECIYTAPVAKDSIVNNALTGLPRSLPISETVALKLENEMKPNTLKNVELLHSNVTLKQEPKSEESESSSEVKSANKQTLRTLLNERCNVCGKDAVAACQGCAKVFFCSNECGRQFWRDGHANECGED